MMISMLHYAYRVCSLMDTCGASAIHCTAPMYDGGRSRLDRFDFCVHVYLLLLTLRGYFVSCRPYDIYTYRALARHIILRVMSRGVEQTLTFWWQIHTRDNKKYQAQTHPSTNHTHQQPIIVRYTGCSPGTVPGSVVSSRGTSPRALSNRLASNSGHVSAKFW